MGCVSGAGMASWAGTGDATAAASPLAPSRLGTTLSGSDDTTFLFRGASLSVAQAESKAVASIRAERAIERMVV